MRWRRLFNTLRSDRVQHDIDREMAFHLAERIDQLRAEGLTHDDATRRARAQFGIVALQAERTRSVDLSVRVDALLRDVRYALRALARTPTFTVAIVLTLALGIGANSAVFSAIDAVLLQPLPFPDGDRLMWLKQKQQTRDESNVAPVRLEEWNRLNTTFEAMTGYYVEDESETSGDLPERVRRAFVAPRFFDVWGVPPAIGRTFGDAEHRTGGPLAVVISDGYWRRRMGADPNVLSRTVRVGSTAFPVIGVMPASFLFADRTVELWFTVAIDSKFAQSRHAIWYTAIGRLKRSVTVAQAQDNLTAVQAQLGRQYPDPDAKIGVEVVPLKERTIAEVRGSLWLLFGAVSVLLLIACTNIAALLLARATHRQQEIAVRFSLGASRAALTSQMLVETAVLAIAGGAAGLFIAAGIAAALRSAAADLPRIDEIALDWRILAYTLGIVVVVALLCGLLPAFRAGRHRARNTLNDNTRTTVSGRNSLQWLLVAAQVAMSVTLLAGAGLLVRSIQELTRVEAGFEPRHVLTFRVSGNYGETGDYPRLLARIDRTLEAVRALPGVEAAATSMTRPGVPIEFAIAFNVVEARGDHERDLTAQARTVSPEYFATMKIPLLQGDDCRRQPFDGPKDLMVNRTFAQRYLSGRSSVLGLHLAEGANPVPRGRIVGVVGDAREGGIDRDPPPTVYSCLSAPNPTPHFLVRTAQDPLAVAQALRVRLKEISPLRSVYDVALLEDRIDGAFAQNRLRTTVLALFAITALLLTCVGLYGTLSYVVTLRRREIGLRLALGARRGVVIRSFLIQGLRIVGIGCACGLALALAATRALTGMLYGVSPFDPTTFVAVLAVVLTFAALAALVPASRAALVEPIQVLRDG